VTSRTILLIEDNPDDQALTLRALKRNNLLNKVTVLGDGAEAIDYLFPADRADAELPGLILLDLKLPKVDGLEVLRRIRADERTRIIPVVVLTSSKEQEDILDSYNSGANGYVRKPVDFADFSDAVRTLGMFWLLLNEAVPSVTPSPGSKGPASMNAEQHHD
jgi:two-component system, response regulator